MIRFMDEVAEELTEGIKLFKEWATEIMVYILEQTVKGFILITAPIWVLPYKLIRDDLLPGWREIKERGKEDEENKN